MQSTDSKRYLRRAYHKNHSDFSIAADWFALRGLFFLVALAFFSRRIPSTPGRILLSCISLSCFCILLHIVSRLRYEKFAATEMLRIRKELFSAGLWQRTDAELTALIRPLLQTSEHLILLLRIEPADGDAVLEASRRSGNLALFSTGGFTPSAQKFALLMGDRLRLILPEQLLSSAEIQGVLPSPEAARVEMALRYNQRKAARRQTVSLAFSNTFPGKYFLVSALLILMSFSTGYALYYRMLAVLSATIALIGAALSRNRKRHPTVEQGI